MKKKNIYKLLLAAILLPGMTSCQDWLDVQPVNQISVDKMFSTYQGFQDALTGCYIGMAEESAYGKSLTMSDIENLACMWEKPQTESGANWFLYNHKYEEEDARQAIQSIYTKLFNIIIQANTIIKNVEEHGDVITSTQARNMVAGEAYAIRAYCHFDILRLFGQVPGGSEAISLPYSYTTDIKEMPAYFTFDKFIDNLNADLKKAEEYLKDSDPLFTYTFDQLNNAGQKGYENVRLDDEFNYYRQLRMNYWTVKGLKARLLLYIGDTENAYRAAMEIINAKGADGKPLLTLSTKTDAESEYYGSPSEALFLLSAYKLLTYSITTVGGDPNAYFTEDVFHVTTNMLDKQIYAGQNTASDVRYLRIWEKNTHTSTGNKYPTIKKYFYDKSKYESSDNVYNILRTKLQVIPMMRLSEFYLMAMETTNNLAEANLLYKTFMEARNVLVTDNTFSSLSELHSAIINEYRREFYGEGMMFYVYKRTKTEKMMFQSGSMTEEDYSIPLPITEYDPNK